MSSILKVLCNMASTGKLERCMMAWRINKDFQKWVENYAN